MGEIKSISEANLTKANAIPNDQVQNPTKKYDDILDRVSKLLQAGIKYEDALLAAGLPEGIIAEGKELSHDYALAHAKWDQCTTEKSEHKQEYELELIATKALRGKLLNASRYALRKMPEQMAKVFDITEGTTIKDLRADMEKLAALGEFNSEHFGKINFDVTLFQTAREKGQRLGELIGIMNHDSHFIDEKKILRNRIFTLMNEVMIEIRDCGKYVFYDQPEIAELFNYSL